MRVARPAPDKRRKPEPPGVPPLRLDTPNPPSAAHAPLLHFPQRADDQTATLTSIESLLREILTELRERRVIDQADRLERFKQSVAQTATGG